MIFPFPLGTRSFTPQEGHLKILYSLRCSIFAHQPQPLCRPRNRLRKRWFSMRRRSTFTDKARTTQKAAASRQTYRSKYARIRMVTHRYPTQQTTADQQRDVQLVDAIAPDK